MIQRKRKSSEEPLKKYRECVMPVIHEKKRDRASWQQCVIKLKEISESVRPNECVMPMIHENKRDRASQVMNH